MRITVILVYATTYMVAAVTKISKAAELCPDKCACTGGYPSTALTVDCHGRQGVNVDQLTEQLDTLLSSNLTYGRLTSLSIVNTPLTHVPRSVCRLTTLTLLHLDNNRLTRLPDNCLTNLTALTQLSAERNNISQLQDGLFDGLRHLTTVKFKRNVIAAIGLRVFNRSAMLAKLRYVDIEENRLAALEPWPYFVGINGRPDLKAIVRLGWNYIQNFTNSMGLQVKCGMKIMSAELRLEDNRIKHISDIFRGWNIEVTTWACISPRKTTGTASVVILKYNEFLRCDCVDFDFYKYMAFYKRATLLTDTYCGSPDDLYHRQVISIPLTEFICELTERCPPGCRCVHRPANATLHVYCSNSNLTALPLELPALPKSYTKYKLDLSNNRLLRRLEHRDYFVNTSILDVSNCAIEAVENWNYLFLVQHLYLHGNRLVSLPHSVVAMNMSTLNLSLYDNPWRCSCDDRWISKWLIGAKHSLLKPGSILCSSPPRLVSKNLMHITGDEFCVDPTTKALLVGMFSFAGAVVILLFAGVVLYRLRIRLYTKWKFHPFDRDECLGEDMDYDVFLSCSSSDNLPYGNAIREQLEDGGYRVCYPPRDFLGGETIHDNIYYAVVRSKRTVCFLTSNFVQSTYCMQEFDIALHHNIMVKRKKRLIVLMALDSPNDLYANDASDTASLRQYLRQYTYIDYTADDWLDKLLYALPLRGLLQPNESHNDDGQLLANL